MTMLFLARHFSVKLHDTEPKVGGMTIGLYRFGPSYTDILRSSFCAPKKPLRETLITLWDPK
jgi:hypothetical protein